MNAEKSPHSLPQGRSEGWLGSRKAVTWAADWIRRHQVLAFFILAYALSWSVLLTYFAFVQEDPTGGVLIEPLVLFSPALMAMLISGIAEPLPKHEGGRSRRIAFVLSWLISAAILILYAWKVYQIDEPAVAVIVFSILAIFPAWVLSSAYARTPGIRRHFSTLLKPRGSVLSYIVVFLFFPGIPLLGMGITRLLGGEAQFYLADMPFRDAAFLLMLEFLHVFLMTGGINEESGWRGFALPRLQARYPVIVAALIVGFLWALWHLPLDLGTGVPAAAILANRLLRNPVFAIFMSWLYNRTNGSILAPAMFHAAMNAFGNQFSITPAGNVIIIALAIVVIVYDRMWKRLPPDHPAVYRQSALQG
jgi:membrane protease YdiL (CAAX protease family)